jgi:hypothetical protein
MELLYQLLSPELFKKIFLNVGLDWLLNLIFRKEQFDHLLDLMAIIETPEDIEKVTDFLLALRDEKWENEQVHLTKFDADEKARISKFLNDPEVKKRLKSLGANAQTFIVESKGQVKDREEKGWTMLIEKDSMYLLTKTNRASRSG